MAQDWVDFRCQIAPGAFSGERLVTITIGGEPYEFVAPIYYLFDEKKESLKEGDTTTKEGWVRGKLLRQEKDAFVALMPIDNLVELPRSKAELVPAGRA